MLYIAKCTWYALCLNTNCMFKHITCLEVRMKTKRIFRLVKDLNMEEYMTILHFESDSNRINALEEMEIMKVTTPDDMLKVSRTSTNSSEC